VSGYVRRITVQLFGPPSPLAGRGKRSGSREASPLRHGLNLPKLCRRVQTHFKHFCTARRAESIRYFEALSRSNGGSPAAGRTRIMICRPGSSPKNGAIAPVSAQATAQDILLCHCDPRSCLKLVPVLLCQPGNCPRNSAGVFA
jgi:hypothetical protein